MTRRAWLAAAGLLSLLAPAVCRAQEAANEMGVGIYAGVPFGITLKHLIDGRHAVDAAFGTDVREGKRVWWPISSARNWSSETLPVGRFCASELSTPERKECTAKCPPLTPWSRPRKTVISSRCAQMGSSRVVFS